MRNRDSRNLVLWLFSLILLLCFSFPIPAQADSAQVPWLTGSFGGPVNGFDGLFSVGDTWQDYQWRLDFSPNLPDMTVTWACSDFYCEGWGGGQFTGSTAYGEIWSLSLNTVVATFTGEIFSGMASREAGHCVNWDECPSYTYDQYWLDFRGLWSNGWYTTGLDFATDYEGDFNDTSQSNQFTLINMTTYTPEPATLTLIGVGFVSLYVRARRH